MEECAALLSKTGDAMASLQQDSSPLLLLHSIPWQLFSIQLKFKSSPGHHVACDSLRVRKSKRVRRSAGNELPITVAPSILNIESHENA